MPPSRNGQIKKSVSASSKNRRVRAGAYLRKLPVDYVKIDGVFVKDMLSDDFNRSIVESIHQISRASGKRTVAEFVEHPEIATALADIGVDYLQGYALDKPGPLAGKLAALAPLDAATVKRA